MNLVTRSSAIALVAAVLSGPAFAQEPPATAEPAGVEAPGPEDQLAALQARFAQQEQALQNHRQLLAQARAEIALKDELIVLGRQRNAELYQIASQILDRYAGMGVGEALARREPFVQAARVDLENRIQDYEDRLRAARIYETTLPPSVERQMQQDIDRRRAEAAAAEAAAAPTPAPAPDQ